MIDESTKNRISKLVPLLTESQRRKYLGLEAVSLGHGGVQEISRLTGASRTTISQGIKELEDLVSDPKAKSGTKGEMRVRKSGGGRKSILKTNPELLETLQTFVDSTTVGNPENPLRWTTKSLRNLQEGLKVQGYAISHVKVGQLLEQLGYSLQMNKKCLQVGEPHVDRDAQFSHINRISSEFLASGQPVISVDAKKKEFVGNFKNQGAEYQPKGKPVEVLDHDFPLPELGKAIPYGVYDVGSNEGFVNVGISADTARFAAQSIRAWWDEMGCQKYRGASKLYITADGGGSNGRRNRLWKTSLQELANETGLEIHVSHLPPGTSKWNKIEHRLFSYISKNWRGTPLVSLAVIISLISATTTQSGLKVNCGLDEKTYEKGIKISDKELEELNITRNDFHGEWNYYISPSDRFA
ncbi:MAG: ISAzo13 family transposase [Bacteroidetes bacterium]|nr:ISAzo13 family transposase [Bacteroidota bacterium]